MEEVKMVSKINSYEYRRLFEKNIANPVSWNIGITYVLILS